MNEQLTYLIIKYNNFNDTEIVNELPIEVTSIIYSRYRNETANGNIDIPFILGKDLKISVIKLETEDKIHYCVMDILMKEILINEIKKYYEQ